MFALEVHIHILEYLDLATFLSYKSTCKLLYSCIPLDICKDQKRIVFTANKHQPTHCLQLIRQSFKQSLAIPFNIWEETMKWVCKWGQLELLQFLLSMNISIKDLSWTVSPGTVETVDYLLSNRILSRDNCGDWIPMAVQRSSCSVLRKILAHGYMEYFATTPVGFYIVERGDLEIVSCFLKESPMSCIIEWAITKGHLEIIKLGVDQVTETLFSLAIDSEFYEPLEYFLQQPFAMEYKFACFLVQTAFENKRLKMLQLLLSSPHIHQYCQAYSWNSEQIQKLQYEKSLLFYVALVFHVTSVVQEMVLDKSFDPNPFSTLLLETSLDCPSISLLRNVLQHSKLQFSQVDFIITKACQSKKKRHLSLLLKDGRFYPRDDAICKAAELGYMDIMTRLLKDPRTNVNANNCYPLEIAAKQSNIQMCMALLKDKRIQPTHLSELLMMLAIITRNCDFLKFLLCHPLVNPLGRNGFPYELAMLGKCQRIISLLSNDVRFQTLEQRQS